MPPKKAVKRKVRRKPTMVELTAQLTNLQTDLDYLLREKEDEQEALTDIDSAIAVIHDALSVLKND